MYPTVVMCVCVLLRSGGCQLCHQNTQQESRTGPPGPTRGPTDTTGPVQEWQGPPLVAWLPVLYES
ncbi:hypothetical protein Hamer_G008942 [Homarus americanus]|uniref:Uncharacterized protein n=1 Tax=Homarus americanus TaxID=6706 RepID=A0A8J5JN29_HOMAM|nr:hypothetical protein Hamer_G008942 [Homarus americanus]